MPGDHVLRYIIELAPGDQASQHEKMHLIYENTEYCELRRGVIARRWTCEYYGGYGFVLKNQSTYLHWIHNEVLDQSIHWHREEENIWISYVMNDYKDQSARIRECENQKNIRFIGSNNERPCQPLAALAVWLESVREPKISWHTILNMHSSTRPKSLGGLSSPL